MAYRSFDIGPVRGLTRAHWSGLPDLVAICGANGSGKSTLLNALWEQRSSTCEPGTKVLYLGPSRPQRRSEVSAASVYSLTENLLDALSTPQGPGFSNFVPQGFQVLTSNNMRLLDSVDESFLYTKHEIAKLEGLRREGLAQTFDKHGGEIPRGVIPDVFQPLRQLTENLIPHLVFKEVNQTDPRSYKCIFSRAVVNGTVDIDIDELSSGEKAVISLFMPFIAMQVQQNMRAAGISVAEAQPYQSLTLIVDEPEIHLHPALQASLVPYLRELIKQSNVQFILSTHSPTLIDELGTDELFMLSPPDVVLDGNQFHPVSSSSDRLGLVRELTGSASAITRGRPIVFVEGEFERDKVDSDRSLLGLLIPQARTWVLVPSSGKSQAISSADRLAEALASDLPGLPVFALVDADQGDATLGERVVPWGASMVENLLLDHDKIFELLEPHGTKTSFTSADEVLRALEQAAGDLVEDEIRLRLRGKVKPLRLFPNFDMSRELGEQVAALQKQARDYAEELTEAKVAERVAEARAEVDAIIAAGTQLAHFRGKKILESFYRDHVGNAAFSRSGFAVQLARLLPGSARLQQLTGHSIRRISNYIPSGTIEALRVAPPDVSQVDWERIREDVSQMIAYAHGQREDRVTTLAALRSQLLECVNSFRSQGMNAEAATLGRFLSSISYGETT